MSRLLNVSNYLISIVLLILLAGMGCTVGKHEKMNKLSPEAIKKWRGTWKEPYPLVGTRTIIEIHERDGSLYGYWSDPDPAAVRTKFALDNFVEVNEDTITFDKNSGGERKTYKLTYVSSGAGSKVSAQLEREAGDNDAHGFTFYKD
jgi:hypothetical protein